MKHILSKLFNRTEAARNEPDLRLLNRLVRQYTVEQQQVPKDLLDLVKLNYLTSVPTAPPGQRFVIDRKKVELRLEQLAESPLDPCVETTRR